MKKRIKLFDPHVGKEEGNSIKKIINSRFWASGAGTGKVSEFENKFKNYVGTKSCVAVNSGSSALHLALSLENIKDREVIVPSLSFVTTAHSILYNGGKPIFADIDPETLCLDYNDVEKKISKKTKVILPVHFAGMPSNLTKLQKIAKDNKTTLIEDAAHACGATYKAKKIGSHSSYVCFSFHPVKNLAMPTGGLIAINHGKHTEAKNKLLARRWCGITDRKDASYDVKELGWNFYMNEFSAGIGIVQLKKLDKLNQKRKKIAKLYFENFYFPEKMPYDNHCCYHFYWIMVKSREKFRKLMYKEGIETGIHYNPIHKMSIYKDNKKLPVTEKAGKQIVSLPTHPNLSQSDVQKIITTVNKFVRK